MERKVEEALKLLWFKEEGLNEEELFPVEKYKLEEEDYIKLEVDGLVEKRGGKWQLTLKGRHFASEIIRRLRLAEWLFIEIFESEKVFSNEAACQLEHILNEEVTDKICTLLGHPRFCPHGKPIPMGKCCVNKEIDMIKPIHVPLVHVKEGECVKVISIKSEDKRVLHRLASFGLISGVKIRVLRTKPLYMIELDETIISIDRDIAEKIFVKTIKEGKGS
ncbi:MAG: metal-dependent transcriptional regulator [Candidatus Hydrothermales bacterium]